MLPAYLILFVQVLAGLLQWCIIIGMVYSWMRPHSASPFFRFIASVTYPMYRVIHRVIPPTRPLDFTPLLAMFIIDLLAWGAIQLVVRIFS